MIESQVKNNNVNIGDKDQGSNKKKKQHYVMLPEKYDNAFEELSSKYPKLFIKDYNGTHKLDNKINKMRYNFKTKQRRLYV
jgi:mannose/fructose/N-acetylgalactosamine-specific phosphotransferase system component IIB